MNYNAEYCSIMEIVLMGSKQMINRLQKLKDKLDELLQYAPLDSQEALLLSCEIDRLIVEYYRSKKNN